MIRHHSNRYCRFPFAAATLCVVIAAVASSAQQPQSKSVGSPQVVVRGLRIVAKPHGDDQQMRPFNWFDGATVALQVHYPDGGLIAIDDKASKLLAFSDDRGTDLTKGEDRFGRSGIGSFPNFSKDGKFAMVEVNAPLRPVKGATQIRVAGSLAFQAATTKKTFTHPKAALKPGTELKAGPIGFKVTKVGKPNWGDAPLQVTFEAKQDISALAEVRFLDDAGAQIKSSGGGTMSTSSFGSVNVQTSYNLAKKVDVATVEFDVWTDMHVATVPFAVTASVGF